MLAGIVSMMLMFNAIFPAIGRSSSALVGAASIMDDRIQSQISIVHATAELNSSGSWVDTNSDGDFDVFVWIKNVGSSRIVDIGKSDVIFGQQGSFRRLPYIGDAGATKPYWSSNLTSASEWMPSTTMTVTLHYSTTLTTGTYWAKIAIPNGVTVEKYFSF